MKGQGTNNRKTALLVVGCSRLAAAGAGDAKVPFEDSYFPGSHGCHTRPPAILRLSLHCGNHNYTCGCLLIAAHPSDPSRPCHPSRILRPPSRPAQPVVTTSFEARNLDGKTLISVFGNSDPKCTDNDKLLKFQSILILPCILRAAYVLYVFYIYIIN